MMLTNHEQDKRLQNGDLQLYHSTLPKLELQPAGTDMPVTQIWMIMQPVRTGPDRPARRRAVPLQIAT